MRGAVCGGRRGAAQAQDEHRLEAQRQAAAAEKLEAEAKRLQAQLAAATQSSAQLQVRSRYSRSPWHTPHTPHTPSARAMGAGHGLLRGLALAAESCPAGSSLNVA